MASLYDITEFITGEIQSTEGIQIQDYKCLSLSKPWDIYKYNCKNEAVWNIEYYGPPACSALG